MAVSDNSATSFPKTSELQSGQRVVKKVLNIKYKVWEMWNEAEKNPIAGEFHEKFDNLKMIPVWSDFFIKIYFYK